MSRLAIHRPHRQRHGHPAGAFRRARPRRRRPAHQLAATIERAIVGDRGGELTVDLDQLDFMDSSGPRALIAGHHLAAEHGAVLRVVHPRGIVPRVLEVTGVLNVLTGAAR